MAIEIVSFPMKNGGSFHSYVAVYQRVVRYIYHKPELIQPLISQLSYLFFPHPVVFEVKFGRTFHILDL